MEVTSQSPVLWSQDGGLLEGAWAGAGGDHGPMVSVPALGVVLVSRSTSPTFEAGHMVPSRPGRPSHSRGRSRKVRLL